MSEHVSDLEFDLDKYLIEIKDNEDDDKDKKKSDKDKDKDDGDKRVNDIFSEILEDKRIQINEEKTQTQTTQNNQNDIIINNNTSTGKFQDKALLVDMGFDRQLVDKIYSTVYPQNIEEALDFLQKDNNDKFTHSYIPNNLYVCSICGKNRMAHAGEIWNTLRETDLQRDQQRLRNASTNINNNNNNKYTNNKFKFDYGKKECGVCSDEISPIEKTKVKIPCNHYFCLDCWLEYLKEKINNANVYKISCMDHKCGYILEEKFVKSIIDSDNILLEKYDKFLSRKKLMDSNKKIKFCPIPDCDGYAEKKKSKVVTCNFGHEFCFECGQKPHDKKKCAKVIDEGFEEWKSHTLVKRCPYCKFWTEKNEGCNHMTCSQCKYQWCWICEKECVAGHYAFGPCRGLHFESSTSKELASKHIKYKCSFSCIMSFIITNFIYLLIYLLMMPCFYLAVLGLKHLKDCSFPSILFYCLSFLPFFICYEVISICYICVISIPAIIIYPYFKFLRYILLGQILGQLFPV